MRYYVNGGRLLSCTTELSISSFTEISEEEYKERMDSAKNEREVGTVCDSFEESEVEEW